MASPASAARGARAAPGPWHPARPRRARPLGLGLLPDHAGLLLRRRLRPPGEHRERPRRRLPAEPLRRPQLPGAEPDLLPRIIVLGLRADLYFWSVLLTHLLNVALLFGLVRVLTGSARWPASAPCCGARRRSRRARSAGTPLRTRAGDDRHAARPAPDSPSWPSSATRRTTRTAWLWFALLLLGTTLYGVGIGCRARFPIILFLLLPAAWTRPVRAPSRWPCRSSRSRCTSDCAGSRRTSSRCRSRS